MGKYEVMITAIFTSEVDARNPREAASKAHLQYMEDIGYTRSGDNVIKISVTDTDSDYMEDFIRRKL